ncbi:hypothetical protein AB835_14320 [Candidatus Endobugula sertula]|uniref:Wadjet protein JetD C-terminal domain-containing protein n=1 Tax=Candidatus Endobugula sertula TaxID=62101 RepID=A0A1D2QLF8_9GAMM|nr:hypothetical protein AB835_14320 [Candidatus Endobugula sertula]
MFVKVFSDTKRIEKLAKPLSFLLGSTELDEQIFTHLGLVKHPQPILLSGHSAHQVIIDNHTLSLIKPYVGLRPDVITGIGSKVGSIKTVLTIENLASFNEAAEYSKNPNDLLIIYVAGNPTPSLLAAYKRILYFARPTAVLHWGDIDVGGFKIAARIAATAKQEGFALSLRQMNPLEVAKNQPIMDDKKSIDTIEKLCHEFRWHDEIVGLKKHPAFQEQENINWQPNQLQSSSN